MRDLVEDHDLRHMPLSVLAVYAQRRGKVFASASTWHRTVQLFGWRRPRHRVHPKGPRVGVRASAVGELLHVDVSVLRLLDGSRAHLQAVMDNFSRKILSWRVSPALDAHRTADLLRAAAAALSERGLLGLKLAADSGIENLNAAVDKALEETGIERILAQVDVAWSNSMIESWWRNLKHQWLFLNRLDSLAAVEKLVAFYVEQHNSVMPHAALRSPTPDEVFNGEALHVHADLATAHQRALQERIATNRALECDACPLPRELSSPGQQLAGEERKDE